MESWRKCWRVGFAPQLPTAALLALRKALADDDPRLVQGLTTSPPPMQCCLDWPPDGADVIAFVGWQGIGLPTVGEVEEFFAKVCFEADARIGEPGACRFVLNFWDDSPRDEARRELLAEVDVVLRGRGVAIPDTVAVGA